MAGLLGVSRGAYYQCVLNGVSQRMEAVNAELLRLIRKTMDKHHCRYGSRAYPIFCVNGPFFTKAFDWLRGVGYGRKRQI